ncbi:uncharacterized protein G2W53_006793 [Senna tora]|uniref:Uncharacterized protein n=1 Tax=Senna tora TaxID=362788 RepID=A0A834X4U3_9FABA|nr:uncharacterized protein G2W53_006793 [Senna tora]
MQRRIASGSIPPPLSASYLSIYNHNNEDIIDNKITISKGCSSAKYQIQDRIKTHKLYLESTKLDFHPLDLRQGMVGTTMESILDAMEKDITEVREVGAGTRNAAVNGGENNFKKDRAPGQRASVERFAERENSADIFRDNFQTRFFNRSSCH